MEPTTETPQGTPDVQEEKKQKDEYNGEVHVNLKTGNNVWADTAVRKRKISVDNELEKTIKEIIADQETGVSVLKIYKLSSGDCMVFRPIDVLSIMTDIETHHRWY